MNTSRFNLGIKIRNTMSKKILLLSASPRKGGNSDLLCDEFMRGARDAGHEVEKIRLSKMKINYCIGCCTCISNQGSCVQQDDMIEIREKVLAADVMVLASPVYFHSINGQMKTFIDRMCAVYTMIRNKEVYFVVSVAGGEEQIERTVRSLRDFTESLQNIKEKGVISITGVWDAGEVNGSWVVKQAYTMGKSA